ncbi:MAG: DUF488 domain-containing protein [Microscillaceae bacterium]|nr:DUF488 domain-containing protein [Microscillaceae bacterium]
MLYYRRKILLALLEVFGGRVNKIDFQKLLLLFTQNTSKPVYDFLPYQYGCYSYQANWDLGALVLRGLIVGTPEAWELKAENGYLAQLKKEDQAKLWHLFRSYKGFSTDDLLYLTYTALPYYAIKSKVLKRILSPTEIEKVKAQKSPRIPPTLYTIGYEGISVEKYFNKLILADVKVLCDVRKNPLSQKYGFSKSTLQTIAKAMGIKYVHIPELGIASEKRQNLKTQKDYQQLFEIYADTTLLTAEEHIKVIFELLKKHRGVALTCFEAHHCQCHRGTLAQHITQLPEWNAQLKHL